jgi:hypothetical protein
VSPTDQRPTRAPAIDIAPLVELVDDLTRRNADLAAAAAMWQIRARQAEEQLLQLTAGDAMEDVSGAANTTLVQDAPSDVPGSPETNESPKGGVRAWWRWLWGS